MVKNFIIRSFVFLIFLFITGEIFFRAIIPACNIPLIDQKEEYHVMCFDTTKTIDGVYTSGRFSLIKAPWHVNNYGFLSDIDYNSRGKKVKPTIAIIGDSFIEGFIIPWKYHVANVLNELLGEDFSVYSIGTNSGTLIQYTEVAKWTDKNLNPDVFVFCLNTGDVESSVINYDSGLRTNQKLLYENGQFTEIEAREHRPNKISRIIRNSAIARYLWINRKLQFIRAGQIDANAQPGSNILDKFSDEQSIVLGEAAEYCVQKLRDNLNDKDIIFIIDANRYLIYESETKPAVLPVSNFISSAAGKYNCYTFDLTDTFYNDYQENHKMFSFKHDYHWNRYGHELVAKSIYKVIYDNNILDKLSIVE